MLDEEAKWQDLRGWYDPDFWRASPLAAVEVYKTLITPYYQPEPGRQHGPNTVERVPVPLPADLDPEVYIELKNKTGGIGFQLVKAGTTRKSRIAAIQKEIEKADEILFPPLQYIDRAMFPGETDYVRPQLPMPMRDRTTLADVLANMILKQREWIRNLNKKSCVHIWDTDHPVWNEWVKAPEYEAVWFLSIRRTFPDVTGKVHWVPEVELRFNRASTSKAPESRPETTPTPISSSSSSG